MLISRLAVVVTIVLAALGTARAQTASYTLGPLDQLQIHVSDLRSGTGEAYEWAVFKDPVTVGAAGTVALPVVGDLPAAGLTTAKLGAEIAEKLQAKVGLAVRPDASVQVIKYRPFYVTGSVDKPGEYEFRPDLTVMQALAIAGGVSRVANDALLGYTRDALTTRGDLRVLVADRTALLARQARLQAEIKGLATVQLPPELQPRAGDADVARLMREEQMLLDARRYSISSQTEALGQTKILLQQQITSLNAKDVSLAHQLDIVKRELGQVTDLVQKGLAVVPRQLALEQNTAQFESDRLDVQLATLRAQQDLSKADRDSLELTNTRRNDALQEASEVRNKLAETNERMDTDQGLIFQAEVRAPMSLTSDNGAMTQPDFFLTRRENGKVTTVSASEGDPVRPGDVLRVVPKPRGAVTGDRVDGSLSAKPSASIN